MTLIFWCCFRGIKCQLLKVERLPCVCTPSFRLPALGFLCIQLKGRALDDTRVWCGNMFKS